MRRNLIIFATLPVALIVGFSATISQVYGEKPATPDYKNAEYIVDGQRIELTNGFSEIEAAPGSASKIITRYFGMGARKDLNGDGREDIAFFLTQERGGSGTFFYVVAAINTGAGYIGSQAFSLGDRIVPQAIESGPGNSIIISYAERKPGEPMTAQPSVSKSLRLLLDPKTIQFVEVSQNFGEADPSRMTLVMKTWRWRKTIYNDGRVITPKQPSRFTLTFSSNGKFSATTDCNNMGGVYAAANGTISFSHIASTQMYCEGSQEADFSSLLTSAQKYHFTSKGELVLDLNVDGGSAVFK